MDVLEPVESICELSVGTFIGADTLKLILAGLRKGFWPSAEVDKLESTMVLDALHGLVIIRHRSDMRATISSGEFLAIHIFKSILTELNHNPPQSFRPT